MTVHADGSAVAFEHADRGAATGTSNIVPALQRVVNNMANRPMGGTVTVGTPEQADFYPWTGILDLPSKVKLKGMGKPRVEVQSAVSRMIRTEAGGVDNRFEGFEIECGGFVNWVFDLEDGFRNFVMDDVDVYNGGEVSSGLLVLRIGSGQGWKMTNVHTRRAFYLCWNGEGANDGLLEGCTAEEINDLGGLYRYAGGTRRTWVTRNTVLGHLPNAEGGHFIQGDGENVGQEENELWVTYNLLQGLQNAFFMRNPDGSIVRNGAAADMIAVRHTKQFFVGYNLMRFGGEFGVTAVHGSRHGSISYNQMEDFAGSAVTLGNTVAGTTSPRDVSVIGNRGRRIGLDTSISDAVRSMIHVRGARDCDVWGNRGWDLETHGLYIHSTTGVPTVENFTHGNNKWFNYNGSPVHDTGGGATPITPNWTRGDYTAPDGNPV